MRKAFILDDEPMFLDWLEDYIGSKEYSVEFYTSVNSAYDKLCNCNLSEYDLFLFDLNVPVAGELESIILQKESLFHHYRGLFVAQQARTKSVPGKKIIVYSVHDDPAVEEFCARLDVTYLPKGRPKALKEKLSTLLLQPKSTPV